MLELVLKVVLEVVRMLFLSRGRVGTEEGIVEEEEEEEEEEDAGGTEEEKEVEKL